MPQWHRFARNFFSARPAFFDHVDAAIREAAAEVDADGADRNVEPALAPVSSRLAELKFRGIMMESTRKTSDDQEQATSIMPMGGIVEFIGGEFAMRSMSAAAPVFSQLDEH